VAHLVVLNITIIHPPALKLQSFGEIKMRILLALRAYMRSGVYVTVECPFVCLSQHSTPAAACGGFAAVGDSLSIDSDGSERPTARRRSTVLGSKFGQCYVDSRVDERR